MPQPTPSRRATLSSIAGLTLIELILACSILLILSSAAMPLARVTIRRQKETELRRDLREMRNAIDRYKDAADKNLIRTEVGSQGYPPDLQTLADGVTVSIGGNTGGISASALAGASSTAQFGSAGTSSFGPGARAGTSSLGTGAAAGTTSGISPLGSSASQSMSTTPSKVRFLRKIPVDPMTGKPDWGLRAVQDDHDSTSWGGSNVFDVYSQSTGASIDGTKYADW
jgi:type II secretory pathway pseudopilin PulG